MADVSPVSQAVEAEVTLWPLVDGPTMPQEALSLAIRLEGQGFSFMAVGGTLRLRGSHPTASLDVSAEDQASIRKYKQHLLAFLEYAERFRQ